MGLVFVSVKAAAMGFFTALWLASVIWTVKDAARRCEDPSLRVVAALGSILLPFVGPALYLCTRPCEERLEVKARRLRIRMLETALAPTADRCPECSAALEAEFRCCPACGEHVRSACGGCGELLRTTWTACPWCAKPVGAPVEEQLQVA